jgi:hypothetical protein
VLFSSGVLDLVQAAAFIDDLPLARAICPPARTNFILGGSHAALARPSKRMGERETCVVQLSRFSFVAQPSSVADDLGSDFFCTIFEIVKAASGHDHLRPLSSFAIQSEEFRLQCRRKVC